MISAGVSPLNHVYDARYKRYKPLSIISLSLSHVVLCLSRNQIVGYETGYSESYPILSLNHVGCAILRLLSGNSPTLSSVRGILIFRASYSSLGDKIFIQQSDQHLVLHFEFILRFLPV